MSERFLLTYWPSLFVIPVGIFLHWLHFYTLNGKAPGLLIPGGIVLTVGIVCQIAMLTDGWAYLWPGFIAAVAVGLFEFYWLGVRHRGLLIPIVILSALSLMFFVIFSLGALLSHALGQPVFAMAIILIGAGLIFWRKKEI
jgi:hypothetical protein